VNARAGRSVTLALLVAAAGCAHAPPGEPAGHPGSGVDSITTALWRMDETGGTHVAESGPFRLDARAGIDTRTDFGRVRGARLFTRSIDSFVFVPYNPVLDTPGELTIEAWINLNAYGQYEDTPIAARWTQQANEQSWMFSVLGQNIEPPYAALPGPGYHAGLIAQGSRGELMFVFQPEDASPPRAFFSQRVIETGKWTHVAVTFDASVVRFWIDGNVDAQYATHGRIRPSHAPLLIGNYFDPRWLTDFGGDLRVGNAPDLNPYYAFDGFIDELRISSAARQEFPYVRGQSGGR
jgi:hypothetical protein